jgi:CopG antitoxin of type II toxin-antitoxin system
MARSKSTISKAGSYQEMGEYWDSHDLSDYWDETQAVEFEVDIQSETIYYPIERKLSGQITKIAKQRGVSPETLLNLWLQEKIGEESPAK